MEDEEIPKCREKGRSTLGTKKNNNDAEEDTEAFTKNAKTAMIKTF